MTDPAASGDRAAADRARSELYAALEAALPQPSAPALDRARAATRLRSIDYPFGSGQGDEIALRAGLKPMFRELLPVATIAAAVERFNRAGLATAVAPRIYGDTKDGWDDTLASVHAQHPDARQALFVGRDVGALREAVALDQAKTDEADLSLGRLLGYPRCCAEAFVSRSRQRKAPELHRAAWEATDGAPLARLSTLDLSVFHFVPWYPCTLRCAPSAAYADRLAQVIGARHPRFVAAIDDALSLERLLVGDDIQVSVAGERDAQGLAPMRVVPTAQHRHPRSALGEHEERLVARLTALLTEGRRVAIAGRTLTLDAWRIELPIAPLWIPFAPA